MSIQLKHHLPSEYSETMRVRTGYETVIAHRTGESFACTAQRDGVVEAIDRDLGIIKVRYTPQKRPALNLDHVASTPSIKNKFVDIAKRELAEHHPIYIVQDDDATTAFRLHDIYTFNTHLLRVEDILPLTDVDHIPMGDYLTDAAKTTLKHATHPIVVKLVPIDHDPADDRDIFKFGTKFTSASGSYVKQNVVCNVQPGETIHRGDVLAYNTGFFELDPFDAKQVTWKHGVTANVVLMEANDTIEDSNAITADFSRRLSTSSSHLRTLQLTANTIIRDVRAVGDEVQTTDLLCTLDDAEIAELSDSETSAMIDLLTSLNRKAPRARYHGVISDIDMLYSCSLKDMHPSLAALAEQINVRKHALAVAASDTHKTADYAEPSQVPVGTKYHDCEFEEDTVLLMFFISEEISHGAGDKIVLGLQAKSVTASVIEKPIFTESGKEIDMIFSARSINNRIIMSPIICGATNRVLETLEQRVTDLYFEDQG